MFTKLLRLKLLKTLALILCVAIVAAVLPISFESALAAPNVGPRANSGVDPVNGIYVSPNGNDATATGSISAPYRSINTALAAAQSGSTIILRGGTYREGQSVRVRTPNITIKSRVGEWAVIDLTTYNPGRGQDSGVCFDVDSSGGKLQSVEVIGGFYAVSLETRWDWGQASRAGASNIIIEDCKLHDSRNDVIKIKPNCDNVTIRYNEIYNSGRAYNGGNPNGEDNSEGIDNVNGDNMVVHNNYIHDICSTGIYAKGGATNALIENNRIENTYGAGIMVGFDTSPEFFDTGVNPQYYENIGSTVRYNLIIHTGWEGIGLYASKDAQVYNNTLVDVNYAQNYHSAIYFGITMQDWVASAGRPANVNPSIHHNIVCQPATFTRRPMIEIRYSNELGGLSALAGNPTMSNNCYYIVGRASTFTDNRPGNTLSNAGLAAWKNHINGDNGSIEVNPALDPVTYLPTNPLCAGMGIPESPTPPPEPPTSPPPEPPTPPPEPPTPPPPDPPTPPIPVGTTYNIADFYNKSGQLSVCKGDIIIVGQKQFRVLPNTYTISYWSQNSLNSAISWWTAYMNSFASGGVVEEIIGSPPPPPEPPTPPPSPPDPPPPPPPPDPPAPAGKTYNIADFYNKSGQLSLCKDDIIIVGQKQYRVLPNTYTINYWSQNSLNTAISWWTAYLNSYATSGVVVLV